MAEQAMIAEWQPIGTVPKDGRAVLLGYFHENFDGSVYEQSGEPVVARWIERVRGKSGWVARREQLAEGSLSPTHWQPVPNPPATLTKGDTDHDDR